MSPACYRDLVEMKYLNMGHKVSMVLKSAYQEAYLTQNPQFLWSGYQGRSKREEELSLEGLLPNSHHPNSTYFLSENVCPHLSPGNNLDTADNRTVCIWRKRSCNPVPSLDLHM